MRDEDLPLRMRRFGCIVSIYLDEYICVCISIINSYFI